MESKFSEQISTHCRLNFSNELIKEPKPLFYPKNIPQKPILFRKKCLKKSLKYFNADKFINPHKNPQKQPLLSRINSLKKQLNIQSPNDRLSNEKTSKQIQFKNQSGQILINPFPETKQKIYKSLEREPQRRPDPKRNIIEELKNYQFKTKQTQKKSQPLHKPVIPRFIAQRSSANLNKSATYYLPRFNLQEEKKIHVSTSNLNDNILLPRNQSHISPIKSAQNINISPVKNPVESRSSNLTFSSPLKLSKILALEKTSTICASEPQLIKKVPQNVNLTVQKNPISYSEKFNKMFGQVDIEDGLKEDLIASIEFQPMRSHLQNNPVDPSFIKQPHSQKSTFINSESKFRKIQSDSDFFKTMDMTKKSQFGHPSITKSHIRPYQQFSYKNSFLSPQLKKVDTFKFENLIENEAAENLTKDLTFQDEFREKCEKRENFRSIISVHSECETSSESEDSIIIDNHPKESISARPIRTLF